MEEVIRGDMGVVVAVETVRRDLWRVRPREDDLVVLADGRYAVTGVGEVEVGQDVFVTPITSLGEVQIVPRD